MSDKNTRYIEELSREIDLYHPLMHEAFEGVINEGVSNYPVLIFHRQEVDLGFQIADRDEIAGDWSVNISTLEELYIKGIVGIDKVEEIKTRIKGTPPQFCCLVLHEGDGSLIFLPRDKEKS